MKDNLLEVGDVLYDNDRWNGIERMVVTALTPKRAKLNDKYYCDKEVK